MPDIPKRGSPCTWGCPDALPEEVREAAAVREYDDEKPWGRLDLRNIPKPTPPTVGRITGEVYAFTRGRRYNVYGKSETGKSRFCYCLAVREALDGRVAVILNGEMADEDVLDWLLTSGEEELSQDAWDEVLRRAKFVHDDGREFRLYQDGDLWALCYEHMTDEERSNFGMEE